jgi:hypothetical protein
MALITEDHLEQHALDQVILYQAADGKVSPDVRLEVDTVSLSQAQMVEITRHVVNVFREGELPAPDPGRTAHCRAIPINWLATS